MSFPEYLREVASKKERAMKLEIKEEPETEEQEQKNSIQEFQCRIM